MKRIAIYAGLACMALALAQCAPKTLAPTSFGASYRSMAEPDEVSSVDSCARYSSVSGSDARANKGPIGTRTLEEKSGEWPISIEGDLGQWAATGVEAMLGDSGASKNASGPTLQVNVTRISMKEVTAWNSTFAGRVDIQLSVKGRGECWSGKGSGSSENYGSEGKTENYLETLNHALDRAVVSLLEKPEMVKALCECK